MNIDDIDFEKLIEDIPKAQTLGSPHILTIIEQCLFNDGKIYAKPSQTCCSVGQSETASKCFVVLEAMGYHAQDLFNGNEPSHTQGEGR